MVVIIYIEVVILVNSCVVSMKKKELNIRKSRLLRMENLNLVINNCLCRENRIFDRRFSGNCRRICVIL